MENLGVDTKLIIAQLVNFAIFFFVFQKFIAKPFMAYLKKQKQDEETREEFAAEIEKRKEKLDAEDVKLQKERKKALELALVQSKKDAEVVKQEIIANAKKEAEAIVTKAHEQMEAEREQLNKEVRQQVASVSMLVVEKALREYLTTDAQKQITQNIVKHIPADTKLEN